MQEFLFPILKSLGLASLRHGQSQARSSVCLSVGGNIRSRTCVLFAIQPCYSCGHILKRHIPPFQCTIVQFLMYVLTRVLDVAVHTSRYSSLTYRGPWPLITW